MADFFFFTDTELLLPQDEKSAFGPILDNTSPFYKAGYDSFLTTSSHKASVDTLAYAVCDSRILVQPYYDVNYQTNQVTLNPSYVNIILKPIEQPSNTNFNVKYYIYRGIKKNSLFDASNNIDNSFPTTLNKFICSSSTNTAGSVLGINLYNTLNYTDSDSVDYAFYALNNVDWIVKGGWSIGIFDKDRIGFDVILEDGFLEPDFLTVRRDYNYIRVDVLTAATELSHYKHFQAKEYIHNFIDPCAFFGNFFDTGLYRKDPAATIPTSNYVPPKEFKKGKGIYKFILQGDISGTAKSNFFNRNYVYVDIRNELNQSLNYMGNYSMPTNSGLTKNSILISDDNINTDLQDPSRSPFPNIDYNNRNAWNWPLLRLVKISTSVNNYDFNLTASNNNTSTVKIALPLGNQNEINDNKSPIAYLRLGQLKSKKDRFVSLKIDTDNPDRLFTKNAIELKLNNYEDDTSGNKPLVSRYIKIKYLKQFTPESQNIQSSGTVLRQNFYVDYLFQPLKLKVPFTNGAVIEVNTYDIDFFVDAQKDLFKKYISRVCIVKEPTVIHLVAMATDVYNDGEGKANSLFSFVKQTINSQGGFMNYLDRNLYLNALDEKTINFGTQDNQLLKFHDVPGVSKSFFNKSNSPDVNEELIIFSFSVTDFQAITSAASNSNNFDQSFPVYMTIGKRNIDDDLTSNDVDNPLDKNPYLGFTVFLKGYKTNATNNSISINEIDTTIELVGFTIPELIN